MKTSVNNVLLVGALALLLSSAVQPANAAAGALRVLPMADIATTSDVYFGTTVTDPYRELENLKDPKTQAWMKQHSDHAHATLKRIAGRTSLLAELQKYDAATAARVTSVTRTPSGQLFYEKRGAADNQFKLYVRQSAGGAERLLVDPEAAVAKGGKPAAINYYSVSPNGKLVAYGTSAAGSEAAVLHVLNVATGKAVGQPIDRADFSSVDWSPDSTHLSFNRLQALRPGMPEVEKYQRSQMLRMKVGANISTAKALFGIGQKGVSISPAEMPFTSSTHDGRWVLGYVINGVQREFAMYVTPQAAYARGKPQWRQLFSAADAITGSQYMNDTLYLRTYKNAPRSKIIALDLKTPTLDFERVVVPQSSRVITNHGAAIDGLYIEARDGNVKRLYRLAYGAKAQAEEIKLPLAGAFELSQDEGGTSGVDPRLAGAVIELRGWSQARQIYQVSADGTVINTGLQPQGEFDSASDIVATEVKVPSHDGALVPMSIIHKKGLTLDGNQPTILYGYASYGITEEPNFNASRLAWLNRGGVFAVANPRGSSVYGQDWYKAGFQATKPNTWRDFIACAEFLIAQKYTSSARLGIWGGSAGGILVGRAMTERPDLFTAVVPAVGALDMIRAESTPNGVPNIPEFGSVKSAEGFKSLLAMSTYHQIKDNTIFPAVLLTHGVNDPRVEVWNTTKTAARLLNANAGPNPILVRLDYEAGHGVGSTKKQQQEERADVFSFFLWRMGVAGFELVP